MSKNIAFHLFLAVCCAPLFAAESPPNVALGKKYTLFPAPTYGHCTDPDDIVQLTDGKTTSQYFWTQKGTVGWSRAPYAVVQIDLEKVEPIDGVDVTTAAGVAGVTWPVALAVHVSDDGKTFRHAGELMSLDLNINGPLPEGYAIRCLRGRNLGVRGRFVRIIFITSGPYIFTDEIRIFRGEDSLLAGEPQGDVVDPNAGKFAESERIHSILRRRFDADLASVRQLLTETQTIVSEERNRLAARLNEIESLLSSQKTDAATSKEFKAILPLNDAHAELFRVQAAIWRSTGKDFRAVTVSPWDEGVLFGLPPEERSGDSISVHAMRGEYRAAAVNLYNATQEPTTVSVRVEGIPATEFTLHDVPWTDTSHTEPVLAALPEVVAVNGAYPITVLPGLVKQVYLTFRPVNLSPKVHEGKIVLASSKPLASIPLSLRVWPMQFPKQTSLLVGGWSYTNGNGAYSVNPTNRDSFLKHLKERFVNAPWARPSVVMNFSIDQATKSVMLDTKEMDDWLAQWPDAREYCIFLSVGSSIKNVKYDAPDFDSLVAAWISAWVKHWKSKGIEPERINLLVADEPGLAFDLAPMFAWSRAIRKAEPKVKLWTDPVYTDLSKAPVEVFALSDVICPQRPQWLRNRKGFDAFYIDRWQKEGKTLQLYSCSGPARLLDPYSYYRLQAWECARINATGSFFWAFGDAGGVSSWNEYRGPRNLYTPLFIDPASETIIAGKQMEAIREGIEDFETIQMLRNLIAGRQAEGKSVTDAANLLAESISAVLEAENCDEIHWKGAKDRSVADRMRIRMLETIEKLMSGN